MIYSCFAAEGHRVLYDREVPFEIRNQVDPHDTTQEVCLTFILEDRLFNASAQVGTLEAIKVKILIMGDEQVILTCDFFTDFASDLFQQNPLTLRIELTSENDLFFQ